MRKRDERVIKKVVDKIIDSEVLLTGAGDFYVETLGNKIWKIIIRNLFSKESNIYTIKINVGDRRCEGEMRINSYCFDLYRKAAPGEYSQILFSKGVIGLEKSPSFKRLVEYIEENEYLILHNDKEYGRSHTLTDADFI